MFQTGFLYGVRLHIVPRRRDLSLHEAVRCHLAILCTQRAVSFAGCRKQHSPEAGGRCFRAVSGEENADGGSLAVSFCR